MVQMLLSDARGREDPNGSDARGREDPNGSDALVGCQGQGGSKWFSCSCKMPGPGRIQMVQLLL